VASDPGCVACYPFHAARLPLPPCSCGLAFRFHGLSHPHRSILDAGGCAAYYGVTDGLIEVLLALERC